MVAYECKESSWLQDVVAEQYPFAVPRTTCLNYYLRQISNDDDGDDDDDDDATTTTFVQHFCSNISL